jgi:hypothetical protein
MASISTQSVASGTASLKALCRLIGVACIAGFLVDLLVLVFPVSVESLEWRIGLMQQIGDRSIILLFGLALLMYGILDYRRSRKQLALFCLLLGVVFNLSCVLVIRDSLSFQERALTTINQRASELNNQIQNIGANPQTNQKITPEQIQQATKALKTQIGSLQNNAKTTTLKTGISSVGNLVIVGLAMIGLGQFGARSPKSYAGE